MRAGAALAGLLLVPLAVSVLIFGAGALSTGGDAGLALTAAISLLLRAVTPFAAGRRSELRGKVKASGRDSMQLKAWYKQLLVAWALLGIPGFVLGWGFAGGPPWRGLTQILDPELFDPASIIMTLLVWGFMISPLALLPFAIIPRSKS